MSPLPLRTRREIRSGGPGCSPIDDTLDLLGRLEQKKSNETKFFRQEYKVE